jgi:hypothetical protein
MVMCTYMYGSTMTKGVQSDAYTSISLCIMSMTTITWKLNLFVSHHFNSIEDTIGVYYIVIPPGLLQHKFLKLYLWVCIHTEVDGDIVLLWHHLVGGVDHIPNIPKGPLPFKMGIEMTDRMQYFSLSCYKCYVSNT